MASRGNGGTRPADFAEDGEIEVLHVDDEPQFRELVSAYLEGIDGDLAVGTAADARDALERLETDRVDCIISDYQMPGMDGIEFLEAVRRDYPNLPFVLFTGKGSEEVASAAVNAGVTNYLQKGGTDTYELLANSVKNSVSHTRSRRWARVTQDRLFGLYEQADGFYILDEDWTITYWNQRIADRTGRSQEDVLGRSFWDVFPEATEIGVEERFREARDTREPVQFEVRYEPAEYWADVRVSPIKEGLFVHSRDITDRKERENELAKRNQILKSFANTVSHDIRNPLSVAEGKLQLAQETGDFEYLEDVADAHNRMRNLIDELLRIARGEELTFSEISLRACAGRAWETVTTDGMDLVVSDDAGFEAHEGHLRRLFENLFWNAMEHGNAETVRVGTLDDGIYVEDDGVGIQPSEREHVFETGYSTADENPGYGLHIVNGIADNHGWTIAVTNGEDGGARFEIRDIDLSNE